MLVCTNFDFDLATNEILLISYNNPGLSKNTPSLSVYDFDYSIVSLDKWRYTLLYFNMWF